MRLPEVCTDEELGFRDVLQEVPQTLKELATHAALQHLEALYASCMPDSSQHRNLGTGKYANAAMKPQIKLTNEHAKTTTLDIELTISPQF